jgi:hypothetical protein
MLRRSIRTKSEPVRFIDEQQKYFQGKYHGHKDTWDRYYDGRIKTETHENGDEFVTMYKYEAFELDDEPILRPDEDDIDFIDNKKYDDYNSDSESEEEFCDSDSELSSQEYMYELESDLSDSDLSDYDISDYDISDA